MASLFSWIGLNGAAAAAGRGAPAGRRGDRASRVLSRSRRSEPHSSNDPAPATDARLLRWLPGAVRDGAASAAAKPSGGQGACGHGLSAPEWDGGVGAAAAPRQRQQQSAAAAINMRPPETCPAPAHAF
ncbi:MAG: hypothetical protein J3K34DRAFT_422694 [Monoraphidium minutum]|nr:MAG: hypothetical protein J3K34DRAFT_422694 [Monoraphidium minutum]